MITPNYFITLKQYYKKEQLEGESFVIRLALSLLVKKDELKQ
jgi:hypothetical protein